MAETRESFFPINSLKSLCNYINFEADQENPCLALVSIVLGFYENALSARKRSLGLSPSSPNKNSISDDSRQASSPVIQTFPVLNFSTAKSLLDEFFVDTFKDNELRLQIAVKSPVSRETIKAIADAFWAAVSQKFTKDRPHIQFLHSFITNAQLDAFGVSCAIVLACQNFGFPDVHLCLSEDHSWVCFGPEGDRQTVEVTWHGKGGDERRGSAISDAQVKGSWVYLDGRSVRFNDGKGELAALVNAINPVVDAGTDCYELVFIQHEALKYLYGKGVIHKFPMALSNLGNLTELLGLPSTEASKYFQESIQNAQKYYENRHVYPYVYYGGFLLRNSCLLGALWCWAEASNVLAKYSYNRDDEEVYKDMYDFAVDMLPNIIKSHADESVSLLRNPVGFALLLKFYDGLCAWEEGSPTPVLHITWSRAITSCISKFAVKVRKSVNISDQEDPSKKADISKLSVELCDTEKTAVKFLAKISSFSMKIDGEKVTISLLSGKMEGVKDLLFADRIRHDAVQLLMTAQTSSVKSNFRSSGGENSNSTVSEPRTSRRLRKN